MITARILISIASLACWSTIANAQATSADEYFNRAGKQYVKEDKRTALRTLDQGLRQYPGDARMLKLAEALLKEEQQKQQQQQQKQQQEQQKKEEQQQEQQKQEQQRKEEQEKQEQQAEEREQEQQERKPEPGRIAPQDAKRILDALEREEKDVQQKVRERQRPARRVPIEKDW